jgi:hypothetical protein
VRRVRPEFPASLRCGVPPLGPVRGSAVFLARYAALPAGVALVSLPFWSGAPGSGWVAAGTVAGALLAFFGLVAIAAGIWWRLRGRAVRGVAFFLAEPVPLVQLSLRTRTRYRPLDELREIEVRYMTEWVDMYDTERPRDAPPWLRLCFENPSSGRTARYCLSPSFLNNPGAAQQLRQAFAGTHVTVRGLRPADLAGDR